jgi:hypothetical protein
MGRAEHCSYCQPATTQLLTITTIPQISMDTELSWKIRPKPTTSKALASSHWQCLSSRYRVSLSNGSAATIPSWKSSCFAALLRCPLPCCSIVMKASRVCQPHSNPDWNIYVVFPFSLLHDSLYGTGGFATGRSRRDTLFGTDMITILSVAILGERVQSYYWIALIIGFAGVLFIVRPGSATFNLGSVFALISVLFYAFSVLITRKLQETDSSATMAYYSSLVYLVFALVLTPLALVIGEIPDAHPSIAFLLRGWNTPALVDLVIMYGLGLVWAGGMYFIARAYSTAPASVVAPLNMYLYRST